MHEVRLCENAKLCVGVERREYHDNVV